MFWGLKFTKLLVFCVHKLSRAAEKVRGPLGSKILWPGVQNTFGPTGS